MKRHVSFCWGRSGVGRDRTRLAGPPEVSRKFSKPQSVTAETSCPGLQNWWWKCWGNGNQHTAIAERDERQQLSLQVKRTEGLCKLWTGPWGTEGDSHGRFQSSLQKGKHKNTCTEEPHPQGWYQINFAHGFVDSAQVFSVWWQTELLLIEPGLSPPCITSLAIRREPGKLD